MTSRIFQSSKVLFVRENCSFFNKPLNTCEFSSVVVNNNQNKMPIIAAVVAHRRYNPKQQNALMTKQFISTKVTPPAVVKVHKCNVQFVVNNNNNNNNHLQNNKIQHIAQQQQVVNFSTSAKNFKSKLVGVFNNLSWNRLVIDHEESSRRFYAKGRDRPQSSKGKTVVRINEEEMSELIDVDAYKSQLDDLTEQMKDDFTKQLSVRGSAGALETLNVEFDGANYPLQELAQIGRKNPQLAVLNLSSLPDALQPVLKAINESGMNLNPQQEGTTIYIALPKVTREHRENLARNAKTLFTKYKTAYQTVQNRYIKQCRSHKDVSEDLVFSVQKQIMKLAADYIQQAETLTNAKQKELKQE